MLLKKIYNLFDNKINNNEYYYNVERYIPVGDDENMPCIKIEK